MEKIKQVITSKPFLCTVAAIVVAAILFVVIGALTGDPDDAAPTTPAGDVTYTVQIVTNGGKALEGIDVFIYGDSALSDMVAVAKTNAEGIATFTAPSKVYSAVLQNGQNAKYRGGDDNCVIQKMKQ